MQHDQLPLFKWKEQRREFSLILFPMSARVGRVREVAERLRAKPTAKAAAYYREQVETGMRDSLARLGFAPEQQERQVRLFMAAVDRQCALLRLADGTG